MKLFSGIALSWFSALSSCSLDLPHDKIVFSDLSPRTGVDVVCSAAGRLTGSTITMEYRKESGSLFTVAFDGNRNQTGYLALSKDENCSLTSEEPGHLGGDISSKYYHAAHQWIADSRQDRPVCISRVQGSGCFQGSAIVEYAPNDPAALGTQTAYIALVQKGADLRIASAFIVPDRETQQFSGFSEIDH